MSFLKKMISAPHGVLEIKLEKNELTRGGTLKGVLLFSSMENFVSNMVRCEIEHTELFQHPQLAENMQQQMVTDARVLYSATQQLLGKTRYRKGQNISLPFAILIPKDSSPSFRSDFVNDIWTVKGVVAVDGRPDITTQIHFQVLS
jgi:hypothetical protein